jgi:hypothetical protein
MVKEIKNFHFKVNFLNMKISIPNKQIFFLKKCSLKKVKKLQLVTFKIGLTEYVWKKDSFFCTIKLYT